MRSRVELGLLRVLWGLTARERPIDRVESFLLFCGQHYLAITAEGDRRNAVTLHAPTPGGEFKPMVKEMLDAVVQVTKGRPVHHVPQWTHFNHQSDNRALERQGKSPRVARTALLTMVRPSMHTGCACEA